MKITSTFSVASVLAAGAAAGSLKDIKHVVLFMQENRAYDHYFGTMSGTRGFMDPNVQVNPDGRNAFQQLVTPSMTSENVTQITPWHINYLGGNWSEATQCMGAGSNSWQAMHYAWNNGLNNQWATGNTPYSVGYFERNDIPTHWDIAEGWTIGDMYQEGVLAATDPNRVVWMSGTVNNPGTPSNPDGDGGMILDNNASPGCEKPHLNCFPFVWKTVPEYWQAQNISWQVYQEFDNFEDNALQYFQQYRDIDATNPLNKSADSYPGLNKFFSDAEHGKLPMISYIVGPAELSEHPPYLPSDGAWLQKKVVDAITKGKAYNETVLMISYDEEGGWGDHVTPYHAPNGTEGEWINDPYGEFGWTPVGPGYRIPFFIVSPWTRGGNVFTEHADHNSQTLFVEQWLTALGYKDIETQEMPPWRRQHMSNLVNAFDFSNPDYSLPSIATPKTPMTVPKNPDQYDDYGDPELGSVSGNYVGAAHCEATYPTRHPPVPYGAANAHANPALLVESGFKPVRGMLTEGRYLTFEMNGWALTNGGKTLTATKATPQHDVKAQRWVLHEQVAGGNTFVVRSAMGAGWNMKAAKGGNVFTVVELGNGKGHTLQTSSGDYVTITKKGNLEVGTAKAGFQVFSVSYQN